MHGHEVACFYDGFIQVFPSLADYRRWVSDDWDRKSSNCCHFVLAKELAPQNPPHLVSILGAGFATHVLVIAAK